MVIVRRIVGLLLKILTVILCSGLFIVSLQYAICPFYNFPENHVFSGNKWFNPYQNSTGEKTNWYKANFHAHSKAWKGLTNGKQSPLELYHHYERMGYHTIGLSNYHQISSPLGADSIHIPVYEHGYNVKKSHRLAIGAREIVWIDFPFGQTLHHKQYILERLHNSAEIVAIAHPRFVDGHAPENFRYLTTYNCIEVLNHFRVSDEHWDSCLSSGRLHWILADDDTHDITKPEETGAIWTMINATSNRNTNIYQALRNGRHFGVLSKKSNPRGQPDNTLLSVQIQNDTLIVLCEKPAERIICIGQCGKVRDSISNSAVIRYVLRPDDTYIRVVVHNVGTTLYCNPVVRYNGGVPPHIAQPVAEVNYIFTWLFRLGCLAVYCCLGWWVFRRLQKKKLLRIIDTNVV